MGGFNIVEHGRMIAAGETQLADVDQLRRSGITALAVDKVDGLAAILYLRERRGTPTAIATEPSPASELELILCRSEPEWDPVGLAGSPESMGPAELLRHSESHYPARRVFKYVSHEAAPDRGETTVEILRCHPEIGSVRQGSRHHFVPEHGWVVVFVEPGGPWNFIERDNKTVGPGPFA